MLIRLEQRRFLSRRILEQYPDRIPVIVEKAPGANVPEIRKKKLFFYIILMFTTSRFLSPGDVTVSKFLEEVRKQLGKVPSVGPAAPDTVTITFLFANNTILPNLSTLMEQVYQTHADEV